MELTHRIDNHDVHNTMEFGLGEGVGVIFLPMVQGCDCKPRGCKAMAVWVLFGGELKDFFGCEPLRMGAI